MHSGDIVRVRSTGRRARIVAELSNNRYQVEYMPDPMGDPIDQATVQSEQEEGIYNGNDLTQQV